MHISVRQYWNLLATYVQDQRLNLAILSVMLVGSIGLQLLNPQILRYFIDTAQSNGPLQTLINAALLFLGIAVLQQIVSIMTTYLSEQVAWSATNALRRDVATHCLQLDMSFHTAHSPGELIERIDGDVTALANFFSQFLIQIVGNVLLLLGVLLLLFREIWQVGSVMLVLALLILVVLSRLRDLATPYWTRVRQSSADLVSFLEERLAGTVDIVSSGARPYVMHNLYALLRDLNRRLLSARLVGHIVASISFFSLTLGSVVGLGLGVYMYQRGTITIGTVYLISYYSGILALPIQRITNQIGDLQQASASIARVDELVQTPRTISDGPGTALPAQALPVEFDHVRFGYNPVETVFEDLSFRLDAGKSLGLLGRTGSGKSSIARLLFRLYDPNAGAIRLGGVDIREPRLAELRQRIALVTQDVQLFHATLRDNLTFFDPTIDDHAIVQAIDELGLQSWYRALPHGLDTLLTASSGLSAGEAQLLAMTRVFLKNPSLVILDEASSRLDPATERLIETAIDRLLNDRTAIIIAHRLQTVKRVDEIMILHNGQIREHGSRNSLANDRQSHFYHLLHVGSAEELA